MCRLFGLSAAPRRVSATFWLLDAPDSLAAQSRREPDGVGLGVFEPDGTALVHKRPIAAYRDAEFAREARQVSGSTGAAQGGQTLEVDVSTPEHFPLVEPVVVGVDGFACCIAAVDLAAREATLRRRPLRLAHAFIWPYLHVPLGPSPYGPPEGGLRHQADRVLADACARAHATAPDLAVHGELVTGEAAAVLLDASRTADLVASSVTAASADSPAR